MRDGIRRVVAGMDGCRFGWVLVVHSSKPTGLSLHIVETLGDAAKIAKDASVIAIDIPIGLPDEGSRRCDIEARRVLGHPRGCSVFPAPPRSVLLAATHTEASAYRRAREGKGLSIQTWAI